MTQHVNTSTGEQGHCNATVVTRCPFYGAIEGESMHYETVGEAEVAAERLFGDKSNQTLGVGHRPGASMQEKQDEVAKMEERFDNDLSGRDDFADETYSAPDDLSGTTVEHVNLTKGTFYGTDLRNTRFVDSTIDQCDFEGADARAVRFEKCYVTECDFSSADLQHAVFVDCDMDDETKRVARRQGATIR